MRHCSLLNLIPAALVLGCASSPSSTGSGPSTGQTTRIVGTGGSLDVRLDPAMSRGTAKIDQSITDVLKALPAVYEQLGIPVSISDPGRGLIGNDGLKVRRRLKDVPLSRYIDCGSAQGMPSAETYDVFLVIRTQLQPTDTGTMATTTLQASARPLAISGEYITCSSTGRLEERIGQMLGGDPPG